MKNWILFLTLACIMACRKDGDEPLANAVLVGEWRYVGTFSHLADYACMPCPGFDYDKASTLNLNASGEFSGQSIVNQYGGKYRTMVEDSTRREAQRGTFQVTMLFQTEKAGTPAQMQTENQYFAQLQKTTSYYLDTNGLLYVSLSLSQANSSNYLFFVRKK